MPTQSSDLVPYEEHHKVLKYVQVLGGSKRSFRKGDIKENDSAVGVL